MIKIKKAVNLFFKKISFLIKENKIRKIIKISGYILTVVVLVYVGYICYKNWESISLQASLSRNWYLIIPSIFLYLVTSYLLPLGWKQALQAFGARVTFYDSTTIYGKSQILRYVPGNIFHFVGRSLLSKKYGFANGIVLNGIFTEITAQVFASAIIGLCSMTFLSMKNIGFLNINYYIALFSFLFFLIAIFIILYKFSKPFREWILKNKLIVPLSTLKTKVIVLNLLMVFIAYSFYCLLNGFNLWVLANNLLGISINVIALIIGAQAVAWIIGFITPGAPGGLGIREAVLIFILTPNLGEARAIVLALIYRIATIIGDVLFFIATYLTQYIRESSKSKKIKKVY
jgi:glycosyltransferase 2 family protein